MPDAAAAVAAPAKLLRYPPQIKYIVANEGCERFSFYGMGSILTVFMVHALLFAENEAESTYHLFVAACYFMPLFGGWLSDRWIGRYHTILWLSFGYVAGHATIALFEGKWGLYAGMALIALGSGGIKPCVSAFVGDQFTRENEALIEKVYGIFYWMINFGSITSQLLIPKLLVWYGPRVAFGVPGVLMAIALVIYVIGRRHYVKTPPTGPNPNSFSRVVLAGLTGPRKPGQGWAEAARERFPTEAVEGAQAALRIVGVFSMVAVFWSLFYQYGSTWVIQAEKMDLMFMGIKWEASQISSFNALFVLLLVPAFTYGLYPWLEKLGWKVTPLRKMTAGMFISSLSFLSATAVELAINAGSHPNVMWQALQYLFISIGEVLVSVTGLEFAYTQAPASMKSTIMGFWFVAIAVGNLLTAWVARVNPFQGSTFFLFFAGLMFVASVIFALIARRYTPRAFVPASESLPPARGQAAPAPQAS